MNLTISVLLVMGGLGFIVIFDVYRTLRSRIQGKKSAFNFHSRLVLRTTLWLILGGAIVFMLFEWFNVLNQCRGKPKYSCRCFSRLRPAPAASIRSTMASSPMQHLLFTIFLMFVGASPASTGGGVKTTTFTVLLALIAAKFRDQEDINLMGRRISPDIMSRAVSIAAFSGVLILVSTLFLLLFEVGQTPHAADKGKVSRVSV